MTITLICTILNIAFLVNGIVQKFPFGVNLFLAALVAIQFILLSTYL